MVRAVPQTDTAAIDGAIAACSGLGAASAVYDRQCLEAGPAGSGTAVMTTNTATSERAAHYESAANEPNSTSWPAGNYVVRLNVTTGNSGVDWVNTFICRVNSSGVSQATVGSQASTIAMDAGIKTVTVSGASQTAAATDRWYAVCAISRTALHGNQSVTVTNNQNIDIPFTAGPSLISGTAAGQGEGNGILVGTGALGGSGDGQGDATGTLTGIGGGNLAGSGDGNGDATGTLVGSGSLGGSGDGQGEGNGILVGSGSLGGSGDGQGDATGTLIGSGGLGGSGDGQGDATGTLIGGGSLGGSSVGIGDATGTLEGTGRLEGSGDGQGDASGTLEQPVGANLEGSADGTSIVSATLTGEVLTIVTCGPWSSSVSFAECEEWRILLSGPSATNPKVRVVAWFTPT